MTPLVQQLYQRRLAAPQADAVVQGAERTSYASLWADVCAAARFLRHEGLEPGARVALLMGNSPAYIAAYYGVWRVGGAVVALNTAAKAADIANWLEHCGAQWLIADGAHPELPRVLERLPRLRTIVTGKAPAGAAAWDEVCLFEGVEIESSGRRPNDLAAIIYTSGTTGRPKGVMLSHENLAANVHSILSYLPIDETSRIVNVLPFYYSYGNSVLHTHLAAGGCLVLEDNLVYPHRVIERIAAARADGFAGVPSTFRLLLDRVRIEDYDLSSLRYATVAGGAMPPAQMRRWVATAPGAKFFVMYGQTEATSRLTYLPPERVSDKLGSCGIAIPGVEIEVRGENDLPLPRGVAGEVCARGPNVMLGYWNDAEATRAALREGWLHTGDLGMLDAEGYLYLQGRRSDMIKTGAHRVQPAEIEEVIAEIETVGEVAVVGVEDDLLGQAVKAFIRPRAECRVDVMQVKAHCRNRLASYKIPKHVELVVELPKTASGKVMRHLLAAGGGK